MTTYENLRVARRGPIVSIAAYLLLTIAKLIAGHFLNSSSLIADGFNNLSDILVNILKELGEDLGPRSHHDLTTWAEQGVLLLNACLTVPAGRANGHAGQIWEPFTDAVIKVLNQKDTPVVFILWGGYARKKKSLVTNPKHAIIESAHPSPLSAYRGFFGSKPFSKANAYLVSQGQPPIDWLK